MSTLIISTGDVSDVDGFYALAEYAKTGADCLFIMNYPAYIDAKAPNKNMGEPGLLAPGLGYQYPAEALLTKNTPPASAFTSGDDAHRKLTNFAYSMSKYVWEEAKPRGKLLFEIGGTNSVNPFSAKAIKIESKVYGDAFKNSKTLIDLSMETCKGKCAQGAVFTTSQTQTRDFSLNYYDEIYMDFCGSMAFLTDEWLGKLEAVSGKIKGVFVMGGVLANVVPETLSAMPEILNRFSCATMNQLYHPENSAKFFDFIEKHNASLTDVHHGPTFPVYVITNNSVPDLKTVDTLESFLDANGLTVQTHPFLRTLEQKYYSSPYAPPKKQAFDFYAAKALTTVLEGAAPTFPPADVYYDTKYGVTLVMPTRAYSNNVRNKPDANKLTSVLKKFGEKLDEKIAFAKGIPPLVKAVPGLENEKEIVSGLSLHVYHGALNVTYSRGPEQITWNAPSKDV